MLKLNASFEDEMGKRHRWSYNEPNPNLTPEEIRASLEMMTTLKLFEKDNVKQFQKVVSAKFVETIETPLFDLSKPAPQAYVADPDNVFAPQFVTEEGSKVSEEVTNSEKTAIVVEEKAVKTPAAPAEQGPVAPVSVKAVEAAGMKRTAPAAVPAKTSVPLAAVSEEMKVNPLPNDSAKQLLEATESHEPEAPDKPINPRKAQVDRVRAFHEAKRKKKGTKKKR
ncbi:DUF2922 domain-containing protein [Candidatus Enterococcus ferrettii]|uniref:Uncharacterized protein n=1 Tax=Candidatus Enterococcus ferrettii TaxID=2815324 RepID=A0ABV0ENN5_9ENTE|nr:DUF2922 domain-containing protein [Enterococcus sp. 665A]MBO1342994.1 DUF2922 domain-containing protein [Enterococcus sp. 665A]